MDWIAWHKDYGFNAERSARLEIVQKFIHHALEHAAPGPIFLVSICAGDSRDVLQVLPQHPRREDVSAWLLESEAALTRDARENIAKRGLSHAVHARAIDATELSAYADIPPTHVCVVSGVFGNLLPEESFRLIRNLKKICAPKASVIWTRNLVCHDGARHAEQLRACFTESAFFEESYLITPQAGYGVGLMRFDGETVPPRPNERFFVFGRG